MLLVSVWGEKFAIIPRVKIAKNHFWGNSGSVIFKFSEENE